MRIKLSQGKFAIIDKEDLEKVSPYKWTYQLAYRGKTRDIEYAFRHTEGSHKTRRRVYLHQEILGGQWIDHVNGNGLDNRKSNLRFCNNSQNQANQHVKKKGAYSQYRGVTFFKRSSRWQASIRNNKKNMYLGSFGTETEAAKAYNKKAKELFGEFATLNGGV